MFTLPRSLRHLDYKHLVAIAVVFGLFMDIMDATIVNVALPRLAEEFHSDTQQLEWVVTGYLLSLAVWIPASGWLGDRLGTKRVFLFAMAAFVFGSALCGRAWSIESLAFFRVLQGVGGGMMTPVGMAMLFRAYPPRERAQASALLTIASSAAPMVGPVLGGFLVDQVSWRWIFYVNVPVGIVGFFFALFTLRDHKEPTAGSFDPLGFVLSGLGLAGILYALSVGPDDAWTSLRVLGTGLGGIFCFGALVLVELRQSAPMLDLRLFCDRMFRTTNLATFMAFAAMLGVLFLLPLYLQQLRGLSALDSGLATFPSAVGGLLTVQLATRFYGRFGPRRNLLIGMFGVALTAIFLVPVDLQTNILWIDLIMLLRGAFMTFIFVSAQAAAYTTIPVSKTGRASSLFSTQRQVAGAFGVAALATVLSVEAATLAAGIPTGASAALAQAELGAYHLAFGGAALLGVVGMVFAWQVSDAPAPPTHVSRQAPSPASEEGSEAVAVS